MSHTDYTFPLWARWLHAGMAVFGILAFLTGEIAEDGTGDPGYLIHAYLGLSLAAFMAVRILAGLGRGSLGFRGWSPFNPAQWRMALEDIASLMRFEVPERGMHQGLAGLTQAFGIMLFLWMAASGTAIFLLAGDAGHIPELYEELHEVGESLIPLYLLLHVGSVLVHSVMGSSIWHRMWRFGRSADIIDGNRSETT